MKTAMMSLVALVSFQSLGSGWRCKSEDGFQVLLYNKTQATRVPAVLVVSHKDEGTLIRAEGEEIKKRLVRNGTRYFAKADSRDELQANAVFFVAHREGADRALRAGSGVSGKLILYNEREREEVDLVCKRYLKNRRD